MPIYEFKCNKCGNCFEQLVFASDGDSPQECPQCGKEDTCRVMSSFSCGSGGSGGSLSSGCSHSHSGGFS